MKQHASHFLKLVTEAKQHIKLISQNALKEKIDKCEPLHLIDVREECEWALGHLPRAIHLSKGTIERDIERRIPNQEATIVLYCSGGFRSVLAAENLQKMGYTQVYSLEAGAQGWVDAGYKLSEP